MSIYRRAVTFVSPWGEIAYLKRELRGARLACSAEAKRANRLAVQIGKRDRRLAKLRSQIAHDQAYIDALEGRLTRPEVESARSAVRDSVNV